MYLTSRGKKLDLSLPCVMGILNVTPDSFFDGGRYTNLGSALYQVEKMVAAGAGIIDIGGEATSAAAWGQDRRDGMVDPAAHHVAVEEELRRVVPVVKAIAERFAVWVSVDTYKPEVMRAVADAGAHMINDIYALRFPGALLAAAEVGLPICLMHMQGEPWNMQHNPQYLQVTEEIITFLNERVAACESAGIPRKNLVLDPGFCFGKTVQHNYQMLAQLPNFQSIDLPLLVGFSRKSMICRMLGKPPENSLSGSIAAAAIAVMGGAQIIRVHDVAETVDAIKIAMATLAANLVNNH